MAAAAAAAAGTDDEKNIRKLLELFHGRFEEKDAAFLLEKHDYDVRAAAAYVLTVEPTALRRELEAADKEWTMVRKVRRVRKERPIIERAKSGQIDTSVRMYACADCDSFWWRRTPERKEVSKCKKCQRKFDPVPVEKMWGWAEFHCPNPDCNKTFYGWSGMWMTSPCYGCKLHVMPSRILPPDKKGPRQSRNIHSCDAFDCKSNPNAPPPGTPCPPGAYRCVHPASRRFNGLPAVVNPSENHDSTGSTVATFLPQDDLEVDHEVLFRPPLSSIAERSDDDTSTAGSI